MDYVDVWFNSENKRNMRIVVTSSSGCIHITRVDTSSKLLNLCDPGGIWQDIWVTPARLSSHVWKRLPDICRITVTAFVATEIYFLGNHNIMAHDSPVTILYVFL